MIVVLCALAWLIKLSYDFYQMSQLTTHTTQQLQQLEKQNNQLNDQVAALHREEKTPTQNVAVQPATQTPQFNVMTLIAQKLDLIEFALVQQQHATALEQLQALDQEVNRYEIATALQESLHQVIAKDILMVQQHTVQMAMQQNQVNDVLLKVDQQLNEALKNPQPQAVEDQKYFWQNWFKVEKNTTLTRGLEQRPLILKEAQMRLLLVRQLLLQNQSIQMQDELNQIIALLKQLPDQQSQQLILRLEKLKTIPKLSFPQLNTRTLVG